MKKNPLLFEEKNWRELDKLKKDKTIVSLIVSPLEEHGPHLPVGTDIFISKNMAETVSKNIEKKISGLRCLLLPIIPCGVSKPTADFPGTISVQKKTVKNIIYDISKSLALHDFKYLVIWTFHMDLKHLKAITHAIKKAHKGNKIKICEPLSCFFYTQEREEVTHAGAQETSYILSYHPHLLDKTYKNLSPVESINFETIGALFKTIKEMGATKGYIGTPGDASKKQGDKLISDATRYCTNYLIDWYQGKQVPDLPKKIQRMMKFC